MDILAPLLFMAIFYLGPALLKTYRARKNKNIQSAAPEPLNPGVRNASPKVKSVPAYLVNNTEMQAKMEVNNMQSVPTIVEEKSAWRGKLDHNMIINGVMFAEILQPPRAYRPFIKR